MTRRAPVRAGDHHPVSRARVPGNTWRATAPVHGPLENIICTRIHFLIMQDPLLEPSGALVADLDGSLFEYTRSIWTGDFTKEIDAGLVAAIPLLPWAARRLDVIVQMHPLYINTGRGNALKEVTCAVLDGLGLVPKEIACIDAMSIENYIGQKIATVKRQIASAYVAVKNQRNIFVVEDNPDVIEYLGVQFGDWPRLVAIAVDDGEPRVLFDNREDLSDVFGG